MMVIQYVLNYSFLHVVLGSILYQVILLYMNILRS